MSIKVYVLECELPIGHVKECWSGPIGLNVPSRPTLKLNDVISDVFDGKALRPYAGHRIRAIGFEGKALALHLG